jgi:hypothetical protein
MRSGFDKFTPNAWDRSNALSPAGTYHVGEVCLKDKRPAQAERQEPQMKIPEG